MGFLGSIVGAVAKPFERALGKNVARVLIPAIPISQLAAKIGDPIINKVIGGLFTPAHVSQAPVQQRLVLPGQNFASSGSTQPYYAAQQTPYYNDFGQQLSYPEAQPMGGASTWGYSTTPMTSYPVYSPTYSAVQAPQASNRAWEDIASLAIPFLL